MLKSILEERGKCLGDQFFLWLVCAELFCDSAGYLSLWLSLWSYIISNPCYCSTGREVEESFVYHRRDMSPATTGWAHRGSGISEWHLGRV